MVLPLFWSPSWKGLPSTFFIVGFWIISDLLADYYVKKSVLTSLCSWKNSGILILTTLIVGWPVEFANTIYDYVWKYMNIPFLNLTFTSVPVIILLGWIPLVGLWVNLYFLIQKFSQKKAKV